MYAMHTLKLPLIQPFCSIHTQDQNLLAIVQRAGHPSIAHDQDPDVLRCQHFELVRFQVAGIRVKINRFCFLSRGTVKFFYRRTSPLAGWLFGERYDFSSSENLCPADPFPSTNFSQLWRDFFGGKIKGYEEGLWMRKNIDRRNNNFLRSREESQSDGKIICLESYVTMS